MLTDDEILRLFLGDDCESDSVCETCEHGKCDDCEYFAMTRGLSNIAIGGVFADVAKELFADDLMPGVTFEDYAGDDSSGDDSSGDDFSG